MEAVSGAREIRKGWSGKKHAFVVVLRFDWCADVAERVSAPILTRAPHITGVAMSSEELSPSSSRASSPPPDEVRSQQTLE